jgi:hypothetical protein
MIIDEAVYQLYPEVVVIRNNNAAFDADGNEVTVDWSAAQALADSKAYIEQRVSEYPAIGDQLDALFHAGVFPDDMAAQIQAVKDKYPKS